MKEISLFSTPAESYSHKAIKLFLYKYIYENDNKIEKRSLEKFIGNRFADVYFRLRNGQEIAIEVQNSKISPKEIKNRFNDYNAQGIYVLWILYGEGKCVASPKFPINAKRVKISFAENILHRIYGGRVYYVNLNIQNNKASIQTPFALHFSKPFKKKLRGTFKTRYDSYLFRDAVFTQIPNWNLLCTEFSGYKIARFYDKNLKTLLKEKMLKIYYQERKGQKKEKAIIKSILKMFETKYGRYMIYYVIIELFNEQKIDFCRKMIKKIQKMIL
ncbi:MAG: competence protein CoiA family protein [Promethearchaeota archaeon]|jgi:competence CoiA-like predicted nuclease